MTDSIKIELPCQDKLSFDNKELAEGAAIYAAHQHNAKLKVYKCRHCELWHLASS